mmetsp:Transcript_18333/g.45792  ORF Transcript_18333/g.45792 Transcript_18333/m.45792 type:complete len:214 (-) Transcript_18333:449-1090(-)|eukprot:CAMPEP_0178998622 /NCGR_PEP_ID=MMETSP0795-20121207/9611_1 /TAXON_ID=88552 /ORGANISM="Amoebophrya sp., Strain Ameob2" /LENGTH=213 /DNA_ID=CAMNT_0020691313 /DNA_START=194 /DNA_END=835 /DNA_ORIENTATION=+
MGPPRTWHTLQRSESAPRTLTKPPGAPTLCGMGQVPWEAQCLVNWQPCQGGDRPKIGRNIFGNVTNPYQFDKTFVNRVNNFKVRAQEKIDAELETEAPLSSSRSSASGSSVAERPFSIRRSQSFEYTNRTPFVMHTRPSPNLVLSLAKDKPGYMGYIPGEKAENVFGRVWAKKVHDCANLSGPYRSQAFDGCRGSLPLPKAYPELRHHPTMYL